MSEISPKKRKISEISPTKSKFSERNEGNEAGSIDKFSNLPLVLIHDILSIIPLRDAIKFCVLSHKWRTIWASRPVFYLSETFYGLNREDFLTFLEKSLDYHDKYGYTGCEIRLLNLDMKVEKNSHSEFLAKKCMDFAFRNKVQTFRFSIQMPEYSQCFHLRDASYFAATLDSLELGNCQITNCSFLFPVLKTMHLYNVCIEGDDFTDLIAGCPQIEGLSILRCPRFFTIVVSNPTLKEFSLYFPGEGGKIKIESTNLESVQLRSIFPDKDRFQISSLITVKRLNLHRIYCAKRALMRIINKFPLLEELHIDECSGLRSLNVSQQNLTSFVLRKCDGIKEIRIDAPKLKSLEYTGGLTSFTGIKASKELELVKLHLNPSVLNDFPVEDVFDDCMPNDCSLDRWCIWLRNCLESFAHSKHLSLICRDEKVVREDYSELRQEASDLQEYSNAKLHRVTRYLGVLADKTRKLDQAALETEARISPLIAEKKKLFNDLLTAQGNIKVFCRVRPLFEDEGPSIVEFLDDVTLRVNTADESIANPKKDFEFDRVYGPHVGQVELFSDVQPFVQSAFDGYNVAVFTYGQTLSGKTHTMEGSSHDRGLYARCFEELFDLANSDATSTSKFNFSVSISELHNEQIQDLLIHCGTDLPKARMGSLDYFVDLLQERVENPMDFGRVLKLALQKLFGVFCSFEAFEFDLQR